MKHTMLARLPLTTEEDGDTGWPTDDIISLDLGDDAGPAGGPKANKPAMDWIATLEAPSTASSPKRPRSGETTDVIAPQEKKAAPDNQTSPQNPRGNCTSCEEDARIPPCSKQAAVMGCPLCPTISVCAGHSMVHQLQTGHTLQPLPEVDALQVDPQAYLRARCRLAYPHLCFIIHYVTPARSDIRPHASTAVTGVVSGYTSHGS